MKNYTKFEIKGYNQERFFNKLSPRFTIFDWERIDRGHSTFKVKFKDRKKVEKLLREENFEIVSIASRGIFYQISKLLSAYGLMAGFICGLLLYVIQSFFVIRVEIWGTEVLNSQEVSAFVSSKMESRWKTSIDTKLLEKQVYNHFKNLSFVSVSIVGQTLIVNVKEELIPGEMLGGYRAIYSDYDGLITEVNLIQGTLAVSVGDIIQKGQVLVLPYIINSSGEKMAVEPKAEIFADVWLTGNETHCESYYENFRTGQKLIENEVFVLGLKVYSKKVECLYTSFDVETTTKKLNQGNLLPFTLKSTIYYETETRLVEIAFEDIKDEVIEKARQKSLQKLEDCEIIKEERSVVKQVGDIFTVSYIITVSRNLGG